MVMPSVKNKAAVGVAVVVASVGAVVWAGSEAAQAATPRGTVTSVTAYCHSASHGGYRRLRVIASFTGLDRSWHGFVDVTTANMKVGLDGGNDYYDFRGLHDTLNLTTDRKGSARVNGVATILDTSPSTASFKVGHRYYLYASMQSNEQPDPAWKTTVTIQPCLHFAKAPRPTISGTVRVRHTVRAKLGTWAPKPTVSYRWLLNGVPIAHATRSTFTIPAKDKGKRLSVRVTGRRTNYVTAVRTSTTHKVS